MTLRRFGWSDASPADAQAIADRCAQEALERAVAGEPLIRREPKVPYNGAVGLPIREEIVERHGATVITRNSYGTRCLNSPSVLFADVDADVQMSPWSLPANALVTMGAGIYARWRWQNAGHGGVRGWADDIERLGACVEFRISVDIEAPPDVVWAVMIDGERWPEWTPSVRSIRLLDEGPLRIGSRALIRQPRFPPAVWTVTALDPGRTFTWKSGMPGLWVHAYHSVEPRAQGSCATLRLSYQGLLARLMGRLTRAITNRYLDMEATGLKRRSEENARA